MTGPTVAESTLWLETAQSEMSVDQGMPERFSDPNRMTMLSSKPALPTGKAESQ